MKKSAISPDPGYFGRYVDLIADGELMDALQQSREELEAVDMERWQAVGNRTYAPGKWTLLDIVQHLIDTERIFCYRALRFARHDATPLSGFSQDAFAAHTTARKIAIGKLIGEWKLLRQSTLLMFEGFDDEMLLRTGVCNNTEMSVLAIGFTICGHQHHHLMIAEERYLPLAGK